MDLIGEALVKIRPDLTGLRFQVQTGVAQALAGLNAGELAGATAGLAAANATLAGTNLGIAGSAVEAADAEGTLAIALRAAGIRASETAIENVALATAQLELAAASRIASGAVAGVGGGDGGKKGSKGLRELADNSNVARGALIGLARVTPVAVFGLGVAGTAAIAAALAIRGAISQSANFEQQLNVFSVVSQATAADMREVSETAVQLGADLSLPGVSAVDAAASMTELAKAGLDVEDSVNAARGVLELGTAASIGFADAAKIAASALNAFDLPGSRATQVADLLAAASISAQGEIGDMAAALAQASAVAKNANISIEDTVTSISLLAKNGLLGSDAGTSLRTTILRLVPTTKEAAEFTKALGIEFEDAQGKLRPLPEIFEQYRTVLAKLPPVLQQAALQQIFGQDAIRAAAILAREGADGFAEMADEVTREGVAAEVAAAKADGLRGASAGLQSSLETLGITVGVVLIPGLTGLVNVLADVATLAAVAARELIDLGDVKIPFTDKLPGQDDGGVSIGSAAKNLFLYAGGWGLVKLAIDEVKEGTLSDAEKQIASLNDRIKELGKVRIQLRAEGLDTRGIDQAIARIARELRTLEKSAASGGATRVEAAIAPLRVALKALEEERQRILNEPIPTDLAGRRRQGESLAGVEAQIRTVQKRASEIIFNTDKALAPEAKKAGENIGRNMGEGIADAISETEQKSINAAREAVRSAQEAAQEQTEQAIFSARDNLDALGQALNDDLATLIDTGPIAQKIAELQAQLDKLTGTDQEADLRERRRLARVGLRDARESLLTGVGTLSPQAKREQREFLKPFQDGVRDANAALKEFDLSEEIESLEDMQEAAKETAEKGINNLVARFREGKISAGEFNELLTRQLAPALDTLKSKAGQNLGLSFSSGFLQNVSDLREQVSELVGFLGLGLPSNDVVRPGDVAAEGAASVAEARKNLRETIENARKTAESTTDSSATLKRIERILKNRLPGTTAPPTSGKTTSGSGSTAPGAPGSGGRFGDRP